MLVKTFKIFLGLLRTYVDSNHESKYVSSLPSDVGAEA